MNIVFDLPELIVTVTDFMDNDIRNMILVSKLFNVSIQYDRASRVLLSRPYGIYRFGTLQYAEAHFIDLEATEQNILAASSNPDDSIFKCILPEQNTPLGYRTFKLACLNGDLIGVQKLIEHGYAADLVYNCPMIWGAIGGNLDIVKYLHSHGADPEAQGNEPIVRAAEYGHLDIIMYLLDVGVTTTISLEGECAYSLAESNGHIHIVEYFNNSQLITNYSDYILIK